MNFARKLAFVATLATTLAACGGKDTNLQTPVSDSPVMPREIQEIDPMVRFPIRKPEKKIEGPAQNKAILFGANCESRKDRANIFLDSFKSISGSLAQHGWKQDIFYSSKAETTEALPDLTRITGASASMIGEGTLENLFAALDSALALPRGSQLLLVVLTHGGPASQAKAHGWCVTYTPAETGVSKTVEMPVDYAPFFKRLELLREEGVRIGVVDESCYSGGSLDTLSSQACVISTQARNRYAREGSLDAAFKKVLNRSSPQAPAALTDLYLALLAEARTDPVNQPGISTFVKKNDISESLARWLVRYDTGSSPDAVFWNEVYDAAFSTSSNDLETIRTYLLRPRTALSFDDKSQLETFFGSEAAELQNQTSIESALKDLKTREALDLSRFADGTPDQLAAELKGLWGELANIHLEVHFRTPKTLQERAFRDLDLDNLRLRMTAFTRDSIPVGVAPNRVQKGELVFFQTAANAYVDLVPGSPEEWQKKDPNDYAARFGWVTPLSSAFPYQVVVDGLTVGVTPDAASLNRARSELVAALKSARDAAASKMDPAVKQKIDRYLELSQKLRGYVRSTDAIRLFRMQKVSLRLRAIDFLNWKRGLSNPEFQPCIDFKFDVERALEEPIGG